MIIKPASELRNNFTEIANLVRNGETVFLTRNGSGSMVVVSQEQYNKQIAMLELYKDLARGEEDIKKNRVFSTEEVFSEIDAMLEKRKNK